MFVTKQLALIAALVASSNAIRLIMDTPVMYGRGENGHEYAPSTRGAPLQPNAVPCNFGINSWDTQPYPENIIPLGEEQDLKLQGDDILGGGSCQISLTTDVPPTEDSVWKTIYSMEGGCPKNAADDEFEYGKDPPPVKYTIPNSIAPGSYSLAWTWMPRMNGYMYMTCAPITVVDSETKAPTEEERQLRETELLERSDLPEMWFGGMNFPGTCTNPAGKDLVYPEPGQNVDRLGNPENLAEELEC